MLGLFKKKPFDAREHATAEVCKALESFDISCSREGYRIITSLDGIEVQVEDVKLYEGKGIASLLISTSLGNFAPVKLLENVSHFDKDVRDAIGLAVFTWMMTVFVTIASLHDPDGHPGHLASSADHIWPDANGRERRWRVVSSPALAFDLGNPAEKKEVPEDQRPDTRPMLEPVFADLARQPQIFAIKIFLMRGSGNAGGDCAINGQTSERLTNYLSQYDWPRSAPMGTLRQYHLMVPLED